MKKLANRGSFSVKIVFYGVLEEDSSILYRFFIHKEAKFIIFIATTNQKKENSSINEKRNRFLNQNPNLRFSKRHPVSE
jgi:hypothetical protein